MRRQPAGFTLIEVLVVITIMAVLTSLVMVNFTGADQRQRHEGAVERLALRMDLARQRAVQRNRELGFQLELNDYEFLELDPAAGGWRLLEGRPFRAGAFDSDVVVTLTVEGEASEEGDDSPSRSQRDDGITVTPPDLVFFRSGELTPFELRYELASGTRAWVVSSDGLSAIRMTAADEL